jgi:sigma factor-binding protein Crl
MQFIQGVWAMLEQINNHNRVIAALKAIGPYLREGESQIGEYAFDCFSVCVDDSQSPEVREFWGWWLELIRHDGYFEANYHHGLFNAAGNWVEKKPDNHALDEVHRTQAAFHKKLTVLLETKFEAQIKLHQASKLFE